MATGAYPAMVKKFCGAATVRVSFPWTDGRLRAVDLDVSVDGGHTRGVPFDDEALRSVVGSGAQGGGQRDFGTTIGELEVRLQRDGVGVVGDGVGFFANGLLELVQAKAASVSRSSRNGGLRERGDRSKRSKEDKKTGSAGRRKEA